MREVEGKIGQMRRQVRNRALFRLELLRRNLVLGIEGPFWIWHLSIGRSLGNGHTMFSGVVTRGRNAYIERTIILAFTTGYCLFNDTEKFGRIDMNNLIVVPPFPHFQHPSRSEEVTTGFGKGSPRQQQV